MIRLAVSGAPSRFVFPHRLVCNQTEAEGCGANQRRHHKYRDAQYGAKRNDGASRNDGSHNVGAGKLQNRQECEGRATEGSAEWV